MKKHLKKLRPLLLLMALFMLTNCQEELDVMMKNPEQQSTSKKKHKILQGAEALEKRTRLINNLKKEGGKGLSNLRKTMNDGITMKTNIEDIENLIDYSEVYEVDQGNGVIHYTYMLDHPDTSEGKFFNIILKTYGTLEKTIMVSYSMDEQFIDDYNLSGDFTKFTGIVQFELVTFDTGFPCDEEPIIPIPVSGGSGPGGGAGSAGTYDPGDGGTTGDGGNPYNQATVDAQFMALAIHALSDPQYGQPYHSVPIRIKSPRYFRTGFDLEDPSNPCDDAEETGIIEPTDPKAHEKNCAELAKFISNSEVLASLNDVKIIASNDEEDGYSYSDGNPPTVLEKVSFNNTKLVIVPSGGLIYGASHDHPNPATTDWMPMFSISDIASLGKMAAANQEFPKNFNKFIFTLTVNQGGEKQTFALKIDNWIQFASFVTAYYSSTELQNNHRDVLGLEYTRVNKQLGTTGYLKVLFKYLQKKNIKGFSIYKATNNELGSWSRLDYDKDTNDITEKPC